MKVFLPDGTGLELAAGATGADAAAAIGEGLARAALGIRADGELQDLFVPLADGAKIEIVTAKSDGELGDDALWLIRHDTAHVLATAVMELYPGVKISIGPPIEDGFYYDFEFPADARALRRRLRAHRAEDARAHQGRRELRAHRPARRRGDREVQGRGAGLQGRADRGPRPRPGRRDRVALPQRAVHRPLPRAARPVDETHQGVQADEPRRRLLAREVREPDAHTRLRHGLPLEGRPRDTPRAARGGEEARPPQARQGARPVHVQRALAGLAVLEAERGRDLDPADRLLAPRERRPRLRRGAHADPLRRRAVEAVGALGRVPRQHVLHRGRGPADGPQAHELPGPHPDLQVRAALLPRPAGALRRGRPRPPPRAERHAARPAAGPPHHPGRRPYLLHRGTGEGRGPEVPRLRFLHLRHVRLRAAPRVVDSPREAGRVGRHVGSRRGRPARRR